MQQTIILYIFFTTVNVFGLIIPAVDNSKTFNAIKQDDDRHLYKNNNFAFIKNRIVIVILILYTKYIQLHSVI